MIIKKLESGEYFAKQTNQPEAATGSTFLGAMVELLKKIGVK